MSGYLGSFRHTIDEKGRLSLPAQFRRDNPEQPLVLVNAFPNALTLYPPGPWREVEDRLREMMRRQPAARSFYLKVVANAVEVVPDKQGRILVPKPMQEAVGITGPTLVVGAIDRIELWDPDRFAGTTEAPVPDEETLTHQIFG